jgi:RNA polymerase sigma factor (sigma-70 family)
MADWSELVKQCKRHDPKSQRELYDQFKGKLMGICRRYAASHEEAQDILQDSFVKIFTRINQLDTHEKFEQWLTKVTINTAVSHYHRNKRYLHTQIETSQVANDDYELLLSGISDEYLLKLINALPDGCRMVFNLSVVEGYSHAEISDMLSVTESTSRSQLNYAKNILKEKLNAAGVVRYEKYA